MSLKSTLLGLLGLVFSTSAVADSNPVLDLQKFMVCQAEAQTVYNQSRAKVEGGWSKKKMQQEIAKALKENPEQAAQADIDKTKKMVDHVYKEKGSAEEIATKWLNACIGQEV